MGRWDPELPFLAPGRGRTPVCAMPSLRAPASTSPSRWSSSSSSSGSEHGGAAADGLALPNMEDIYDMRTDQLAALEERLGARAAGGLATAKEQRLRELARVELTERRGVEEIGLALVGGRLDLSKAIQAAADAAKAASAASAAHAAHAANAAKQRLATRDRPRPAPADEVMTTLASSPSSSSRSVPFARSPSPKAGQRSDFVGSSSRPTASPRVGQWPPFAGSGLQQTRSPSVGQLSHPVGHPAQPASRPSVGGQPSAGFKPTPVHFDFVIASSSVRKGKAKPRKKKQVDEDVAPQAKLGRPPPPAGARASAPAAKQDKQPVHPAANRSHSSVRDVASSSNQASKASSSSGQPSRGRSLPPAAGRSGRPPPLPSPQPSSGTTSSGAFNSARGATRAQHAASPQLHACVLVGGNRSPRGGESSETVAAESTDLPEALAPEEIRDEPSAHTLAEYIPASGWSGDTLQSNVPIGSGIDCDEAASVWPIVNDEDATTEALSGLRSVHGETQDALTSTFSIAADSPLADAIQKRESFTKSDDVEKTAACTEPLQVQAADCEDDVDPTWANQVHRGHGRLAGTGTSAGLDDEDWAAEGEDDEDDAGEAVDGSDHPSPQRFGSRPGSAPTSPTQASLRSSIRAEAYTADSDMPLTSSDPCAFGPSPISADDEEADAASDGVPAAGSDEDERPRSQGNAPSAIVHVAPRADGASEAVRSTGRGRGAGVPESLRAELRERESEIAHIAPAPNKRRPPLPHDTLRPVREVPPRLRQGDLDLCGLDPQLVAEGKITSYAELYPSLVSIFTWGTAQPGEVGHKRETCLREAQQVFGQFCDVIGSLETHFKADLAPSDNMTPSATQQALNAMDSRGAGLYGVFLKGILDKLPGGAQALERVPRPLSAPRSVFSLRYYKVVQNRTEVYDIVTRTFHRKQGWEELPHGLGLANAWNLLWTWSKPKLDHSRLCVWQKVNHYPEAKYMTRKDYLKRSIERYTRTGGKIANFFNIMPRTFVLPKEYCAFVESFAKIAEENGDLSFEQIEKVGTFSASAVEAVSSEALAAGSAASSTGAGAGARKAKVPNLWIMKPAGSSRGRGIQVVNDVGSVHYAELTIIQQYLSDPFLLDGYKWDMRVYVTVTSFNPLEVFIYKEGFARFTTVPYTNDSSNIDNLFVHLTNSSIQRHNEDSMMQGGAGSDEKEKERQQDVLLGGTKICFATLKKRLEAVGVKWEFVWSRMIDVILKSLVMAEDHIPHQCNSFELFGYDLILDSKLRCWLIEVNSSPSMGQEHLLDEQVKQPLISDTIDLVEPLAFDRRKLADVLQRRLERKASTTSGASNRKQLDIDLHAILNGQLPRPVGVMPERMGNYERIAPGAVCDNIQGTRGMLFNK